MKSFLTKQKISILKVLVFIFVLVHLAYFIIGLFFDYLGPNPVEVLTHETGEWGLIFLLATLFVTPLRLHFSLQPLFLLRRFLGLCSFFYVLVHLLTYITFDYFFDWKGILSDIIERPYIAVGMAGFILMCPLAITSFKKIQKQMGRSWLSLHRLIYVIACCGVVHFWWLVKADYLQPIIYGSILLLLFSDRIYWFVKNRVNN
jgi:sulfoxide reductase heme-binding subunit YedZ